MTPALAEVLFVESAADLRRWFEANHGTAPEQWIGYFKKTAGRTGLTYGEAVDEALCFGWIDGQVRGLDEQRYANRYTPRRPGSIWSTVNVRRMNELIAEGRVRPAGLRAFAARLPERTGVYAYDAESVDFPPDLEARFRADERAWQFFSQQPPGYRRSMTWWVVSSKRDETRAPRLAELISESAAARRVDQLNLPKLGAAAVSSR